MLLYNLILFLNGCVITVSSNGPDDIEYKMDWYTVLQATPPAVGLDKLEIKIFDDKMYDGRMEQKLREALETTKSIFSDERVQAIIKALRFAGKFSDVLGPITQVITTLTSFLQFESDWKKPFVKKITESTIREIMESQLFQVKAKSKVIDDQMRFFNDSFNELSHETKSSIILDIHNALYEIILLHSLPESPYRDYLSMVLPTVITFSRLSPVFFWLMSGTFPERAARSLIPCTTVEILREFQSLEVDTRKLQWTLNFEIDTRLQKLRFDSTSPSTRASQHCHIHKNPVNCHREDHKGGGGVSDTHIIDEVSKENLYICPGNWYSKFWNGLVNHDCSYNYIMKIKDRVNKYFDDMIALVDETCTDEHRHRDRQPTGFGYWKVVIGYIKAIQEPGGSSQCDGFLFGESPCDPFVRVFINGNNVFSTDARIDTSEFVSWATYKSDLIAKNSTIKFQLWDLDDSSGNDLLLDWDTNIDELMANGYSKANYYNELSVKSYWVNQYDRQ